MINRIFQAAQRAFFFILLSCAPALAQAQEAQEKAPILHSEITTAKKLIDIILESIVKYGFQVLGGIIVLIIGWFIANFATGFARRFFQSHKVDVTVTKFLTGAIRLLIMGFALLVALGKFGIEIAPFIAGLSVVGFGTSFALQGPLSNYAAGVTLIFTKPFKVGDIIEVVNIMGEVQDMSLAATELTTVDGTKIIIPNKHIIGEIIQNYSEFKWLDVTVGIAYDSDVSKAIKIVCQVIKNDPRVFRGKEPKVGISEFADSSITVYGRLWCRQADYWDARFDINQRILEEFNKNNIVIPFPQRVVHVVKDKI